MKIAMFTDSYHPTINGVVNSIDLFREELERLGHKVYIFCPKVPGTKYKKNVYAVPSVELKSYPEYRIGFPRATLYRKTKEINPDIIHIHSPAFVGIAGLAIARHLRKPVVMTYHTMFTDYSSYLPGGKYKKIDKFNKKFLNRFTRSFFNRGFRIIAPSEETKRFLRKVDVKKKISILPTGIKIPRKSKQPINDKPILLHVGRLCKEKNIEFLLHAFADLLKHTDAQLIITSSGPVETKLKRLAKHLKIDEDVTFTGYVSEEEKERIYKKADMFVSASTTDTQGIVVLEAMSHGTPPIVPSKTSMGEFVENGKTGLLFSPGKKKDLVRQMQRAVESEKLRKKLRKNAYEAVKEFDIKKLTKTLLDVYGDASHGKKISVVIPTYMEGKYISKTLHALSKQTYPNFDVTIVDSKSTDDTVKKAREYVDNVIVAEKRGISNARNMGARKTDGDIILFLDADTILGNDFLEKVAREFETKDVVGVSGYIETRGTAFERLPFKISAEGAFISSVVGKPLFYGMCMAWRRDIFNKLRGFNEKMETAEDLDFTERACKHGKCVLLRNARANTSSRRVIGMGVLGSVIYHAKNFARFKLHRKTAKNYPVVR